MGARFLVQLGIRLYPKRRGFRGMPWWWWRALTVDQRRKGEELMRRIDESNARFRGAL